ncbi:MAG: class I SAM-dependent methyltransferase [Candidatus Thorarchaeota archaeon]|nr:class I SAM-dependent methyltransferase [Candidatus Thorarchaeota archaeon]
MVENKEKQDRHFPVFAQDNLLRRLLSNSKKFNPYVTEGQVVADLGCGPGYFTLPLAECVGPLGRVYAVDSNEKAIRALEKKADKHGYSNIEAHAASASDLSFIKDGSVDFVLANGLLCSMAPKHHESTVNEIKRILKPQGQAYIAVDKGRFSYVEKAEWEKILEGFRIEGRGDSKMGDRWAVVSIKHQ